MSVMIRVKTLYQCAQVIRFRPDVSESLSSQQDRPICGHWIDLTFNGLARTYTLPFIAYCGFNLKTDFPCNKTQVI